MTVLSSPANGFENYYIFLDGFDEYGSILNLDKKWTSSSITTSELSDGRIAASNSNILSKSLFLKNNDICQYDFESNTHVALGIAFKIPEYSTSATVELLQFFEASNMICGITLEAGGNRVCFHGSTLSNKIEIDDKAFIQKNIWYYLEVIFSITGTISKFINADVYLNSTFLFSDSATTLRSSFNRIKLLGNSNGVYFDDLKLIKIENELQGVDFTLGDARIITFVPTSTIDLATTQFTAVPSETDTNHHRPVSGSIPDDDTSYLQSIVSGSSELFGYDFAQIPTNFSIEAIGFNNYARKTSAIGTALMIATENFTNGSTIKSYGLTGSGDAGTGALTTSYSYLNSYLSINGTVYTKAKLVAGEAGIADEG